MSDKIYIAGVGMTQFGRHPETGISDLLNTAVLRAADDAGCTKSAIEAVFHSSATQGILQGQSMVAGQVALSKIGLSHLPVFNIENACASSSSSFHLAVQALKARAQDVVLVAGVEKMNVQDKSKMFSVFDGAWDVQTPDENVKSLLRLGEGLSVPDGSESDKPYSIFMKIYAAFARNHMKRYGTTQRQIAAIAAKNHQHSVHNEYSQYRRAYSVEEVLSAPPITYPLTLPMCSPISDGAAAMIVCNEEGLRKIGCGGNRAVEILASAVASGDPNSRSEAPERHVARRAAIAAYECSGLSPEDVDVAEVHDATAVGELLHAENLMLVPIGEAGAAAERGDFTIGGAIPINPSGGLLSKGEPLGASALGQVVELTRQLRGECGVRQVDGARAALAHVIGRGANAAVTILTR